MPRAVPARRRAGGLFFAAAAALGLAGVLVVAALASHVAAERWVGHTMEVRRVVYEWLATLLEGESGARGYVGTGNPMFLEPYESAVTRKRIEATAVENLPHTFSVDERAFLVTLADQCAQAVLRASRREREDKAQRWFTTTLRSIGDAVIATDVEGRVRFMNPIAERLTGWSQADAQGRPLDDVFVIFSETTRSSVESPVAKVIREGKVVGLANHTLLRSRRGTEVPIDDSGAPIRGEDGRLIGIVLVFRDASQEKRTRARSEFLAKAGEALVSSLDHEATLANVARLTVPMFCRLVLHRPARRENGRASPGGGRLHGSGQSAAHTT